MLSYHNVIRNLLMRVSMTKMKSNDYSETIEHSAAVIWTTLVILA